MSCILVCHIHIGMLSKSMGQILRVSAAMHVLFHVDEEGPLASNISDIAIEAAIDFVEVCCQHTAYITGRGNINQELDIVQAGMCINTIIALTVFSTDAKMHIHVLYNAG